MNRTLLVCALSLVAPALAQVSGDPVEVPVIEANWDSIEAIDKQLFALGREWLPVPNKAPWGEEQGGAPAPEALPVWGGDAPTPTCPGGTAEPTLAASFLGVADTRETIPPDTMGAVGPDHIVTMTNARVLIQQRDGTVLKSVTMNGFWYFVSPVSACDPKVIFDTLTNRWIAAAIECGNFQLSRVFVAMSTTANPTDPWRFAALDADAANVIWADYPQLGTNSKWIVLTANMFPVSSGPAQGSKMWVVDKSTLAQPGFVKATHFAAKFDAAPGWTGFTLQPSVTFDPNEENLYLIDSNVLGGTTPALRLSRVIGTPKEPQWEPVSGTNTSVPGAFVDGLIPINRSTHGVGAEQKDESRKLEAINSRLLHALNRNGRIWAAYGAFLPATGTPDRIGAAWVQVDPNAMPSPVVQMGIIEGGPRTYHIYPSLAVNCADDVVIGFTRTDPGRYPEAAYAARLGTDPLGTMRPVRLLKAGEDPYYKTYGGTRNRWGDYSSTVVDPRDELSFWTTQEYAQKRGNGEQYGMWGTWWGHLKVVRGGDMNCDGLVSAGDIDPFVLALSDAAAYATRYPDCNLLNGDIDGDRKLLFDDINGFVALLSK